MLGSRLFSPRIGLIAAALATVDLPHIVYSNMIMSDVPFAACALAAFVMAARAVGAERSTLAISSGLLSGLATMVRPVGALLFVPLAGYAVLRGGRYRLAAAIVTGAVILPGAWVARNALVVNWPTLSSAHYFNLYHYAAARVAARAEGVTVTAALQQSQQRAAPVLDGLAPPEWSHAYARLGMAIFRRYPESAAIETLASLAEMLAMGERRNLLKIVGNRRGLEEGAGFRDGPRHAGAIAGFVRSAGATETLLMSGQVAWNVLILLAAMLAVWRLWHEERRAEAWLLGLVCAYLAGASVMEGSGRMRLAFSPYLFVLAAYGMSRWWDRWNEGARSMRWHVTRACAIVCLALGGAAVTMGAAEARDLAIGPRRPLGQPVTVLDRLLATVADQPITLSDVRAARLLGLVPETDDTAAVVERLIDRELIRIEVERFVTAEPPANVIDARLAAVRERLSRPGTFDAAVRATGLTVEQLRAVLRDEVRIAAYLEQRFGSTAANERSEAIDEWVASLRRRATIKVSGARDQGSAGIRASGVRDQQASVGRRQGRLPGVSNEGGSRSYAVSHRREHYHADPDACSLLTPDA
ncbi:MAG: glycosyltransferase family 39 protein [Dehalococcoidia bacterium]